jgi:hypothetical protein
VWYSIQSKGELTDNFVVRRTGIERATNMSPRVSVPAIRKPFDIFAEGNAEIQGIAASPWGSRRLRLVDVLTPQSIASTSEIIQ